jgi:PKHD-type hydroxylase
MLYRYELLSEVQLKHVGNFYDFCDWIDGSDTGSPDKNLKSNLQMDYPNSYNAWDLIKPSWEENHVVMNFTTPVRQTLPIFARYLPGHHYDWHCDATLMGGDEKLRSDVSTTIFLSNPDDYEGGELLIELGTEILSVKLPAGWAFSYPTGLRHKVTEVTDGVRDVALMWHQSMFRNISDREAFGRNRLMHRELSEKFSREDLQHGGSAWQLQKFVDEEHMYLIRSKAEL